MTRIGVGYGNDRDPLRVGREAAAEALQSGGLARADLAIAFCCGDLDHDQFFQGIREVVGAATPIIGGTGVGIITRDQLAYQGNPAAVALLESDTLRFSIASAGGMDRDGAAAGRELVAGLELSEADRLLLLFYDSVRVPAGPNPPVLNSSAPLLDGVEGKLSGHVPVYGSGLVGGYGFGPTWQFCGFRTATQHAVGCLISGEVSVHQSIMHGCIPLNGVYHTITRMQGDVIYELDGQPVVPMIDALFGGSEWQQERPIISNLTIGVNYGERFGAPLEENYVNRLITGVTPDGTGIGMFEADLHTGQEIQFMIRDNRMMLQSVRDNAPALLRQIEAQGRRPVFALYINCGGRAAAYSATVEEEAAEIQRAMQRAGVPLLGFYTGVELAPMLGRSRGLDWTGVLVVLAEDR